MAEHGVSNALYLRDPDGIGVELTWDRPPEEWPRDENISLVPINDSLDVNELLEGHALRSAMFTTLFPERRPHRRTCKYMSLLLCELHAHTTWSDGELSLQELVDLYGRAGFDVLCVTDHTHPPGDPWERLGIRPSARLPISPLSSARPSEPGRSTCCSSSPGSS